MMGLMFLILISTNAKASVPASTLPEISKPEVKVPDSDVPDYHVTVTSTTRPDGVTIVVVVVETTVWLNGKVIHEDMEVVVIAKR